MKGLCCSCQTVVDVRHDMQSRQEERDRGWEDDEISREYGDSINYVCDSHEFFGEFCEGSGMVPQTLVKEN